MIRLVKELADLDSILGHHLARILILLLAFEGREHESLRGLTKLAKLDFLLRYPTYLVRALKARGRSARGVELVPHESTSVESEMVRYRFGPWDPRYRHYLAVLSALRLASVEADGRTIVMSLTARGREVANSLREQGEFQDTARRSALLKSSLDLSATNLMRFIYDTFPEVASLRSNEVIEP